MVASRLRHAGAALLLPAALLVILVAVDFARPLRAAGPVDRDRQ
jgi:hypothetical protein